jgi:precorrin-3B C17-methyltransferase
LAKKLYILSSGAGGDEFITKRAFEALKQTEVVVAYTKYAKELKHLLEGKELFTSGMTKEIERCKIAIELAKSGKTTAIISNGDVNVYGMATLIVELIDEMELWDDIEVENIAGVTALLAVASRVGAPLSQDFAVISLSDRLTSPKLIRKRVKLSLEADFVIGIYNPKSRTRIKPYLEFLEELEKVGDRLIVIASNVGRPKEKITITTSRDLIKKQEEHPDVTMSTLILVGNSNTKITKNGLLLTPRGYLNKYDLTGELKSE